MTEQRELYEFAAATTDVPWAEAEACGWFNCPDAGGWLRQVDGFLVAGSREEAVERIVTWLAHGLPIDAPGKVLLQASADMLLRAACGEGDR